MSSPLWRNAASLLVAVRSNYLTPKATPTTNASKTSQTNTSPSAIDIVEDGRFDYRLLLLKRSAKSGFMANTYVFPGGLIESTDNSTKWLPYFQKYAPGMLKNVLERTAQIRGPRPPLFSQVDEITCRIAAVRETFEETGLLLCSNSASGGSIVPADDLDRMGVDLEEWRRKVYADSNEFFVLCGTFGLYPAISCLYEWSNWLTPAHLGPRRYDTIFYFITLPSLPRISIDQKEIANVQWNTPLAALEQSKKGCLRLGPPQVYEMCRLANIQSFVALSKFLNDREPLGCHRWLPVHQQLPRESAVVLSLLLPGDSSYPSNPDDEVQSETPYLDKNMGNIPGAALHRMEHRSRNEVKLRCNIQDPHGHLKPLEYPNLNRDLVGKL